MYGFPLCTAARILPSVYNCAMELGAKRLQSECLAALRACGPLEALAVYEDTQDPLVRMAAVRALAVGAQAVLGGPEMGWLLQRQGLEGLVDCHTQSVDFTAWAKLLLAELPTIEAAYGRGEKKERM